VHNEVFGPRMKRKLTPHSVEREDTMPEWSTGEDRSFKEAWNRRF
jgi:hypothetical protein